MALEKFIKSSTTVIGKGKSKKEIVEVAFSYEFNVSEQVAKHAGWKNQYLYDTGSTPDDPYGLMMVRMENMISLRADTDFGVDVDSYMFATEHLDDSDKFVGFSEHALVDNVLVRPRIVLSQTLGGVFHTLRNYTETDFRKALVANTLGLNTSQGIVTPDSEGTDSIVTFFHKYVFQKVKMTKAEYLEKFATRVCT